MEMRLSKKVVSFLKKRPEERFTANDIAKWIIEEYPEECEEKRSRSAQPNVDICRQLVAEISRLRPSFQKKNQEIKTTEDRPRKYYWTTKSEETEIQELEQSEARNDTDSRKERDLYPLLSQYLTSEFEKSLYSKRIDEKKSSNQYGRAGNKWLHPDVVGMEVLTSGWHDEIKNVIKEYADKRARLWSFEVKLLLNRSNIREAFFQAVSNSSWANFGYLVAAEISGNIKKELRILSALHGIGVIQLDVENPVESNMLIPARERLDVDWATCNRLAEENRDFVKFIRNVREFNQSGNPGNGWDDSEGY